MTLFFFFFVITLFNVTKQFHNYRIVICKTRSADTYGKLDTWILISVKPKTFCFLSFVRVTLFPKLLYANFRFLLNTVHLCYSKSTKCWFFFCKVSAMESESF